MEMKLGVQVRDRITGVEGIVFGVTEWMYGCRTITVKPRQQKDGGGLQDNISFDEPQLEVIGAGLAEQAREANKRSVFTGGPDRPVSRDRTP